MVHNWLSPTPIKQIDNYNKLNSSHFGKKIKFHKDSSIDLSTTQVALIGIQEKESNAIREVLYSLSFPFKNLNITDLGNTRKVDITFLVPLIKELTFLPVWYSENFGEMRSSFNGPLNKICIAVLSRKLSTPRFLLLGRRGQHLFQHDFFSNFCWKYAAESDEWDPNFYKWPRWTAVEGVDWPENVVGFEQVSETIFFVVVAHAPQTKEDLFRNVQIISKVFWFVIDR